MIESNIGLEIHVELRTSHKIFCNCINSYEMNPNIHTCPICMGLPGALPTFNKDALELAIKAGLALNCKINLNSRFDRKNYFYIDLPKGYQISQLYEPLCRDGFIDLPRTDKRIGIHEIHMEEDAAKLVRYGDEVLVDYNRSGVPLIEIVTNPDFNTQEEVVEFLECIKSILVSLDVSDCKMEQGSMRVDINLSVHELGSPLGTRTEMKNLSSFKAVSKAIEYERERQINILEQGDKVIQETLRWDEKKEICISMRAKENYSDYKYFPEPDLEPIVIDKEYVEAIRDSLPELPMDKQRRYVEEYGLSSYEASVISRDVNSISLFEGAVKVGATAQNTCNFILTYVLKLREEYDTKLDVTKFGRLIMMVDSREISIQTARDILVKIYEEDVDPIIYARDNNLVMIEDEEEIARAIDRVIASHDNSKAIEDYKKGKKEVFSYIFGKVMKELNGKANPLKIKSILVVRLSDK